MFAPRIKAPQAKAASQAAPALGPKPLPKKASSGVQLDAAIPLSLSEVLRQSGEPLDAASRSYFEPRFKHDFSAVRIHADPAAAQSARAVGAIAYTIGHHIVFGSGARHANTPAGRTLMTHELTHVVQQTGGTALAAPGPEQERDAEAAAQSVLSGAKPQVRAPSGVGIAEQAEQGAAALSEEQKTKLNAIVRSQLKPTSIAAPQPQDFDRVIGWLKLYRNLAPGDFDTLVVANAQEIDWWLNAFGFRGTRFREAPTGRFVVDVFQTVSDLDAAIERWAQVRGGERVAPFETGPSPEQIEAREQQEVSEELEDRRVYTGPRRALRQERSYAVGNVVQQKIAGIKESGPLSLVGRVIGTAYGGEKWGDFLATIGTGLDLGFTLRAGGKARRQASSANYDRPRPASPSPGAEYRDPAHSAPAPTREPIPTPDPIVKVPTQAKPLIVSKAAPTAAKLPVQKQLSAGPIVPVPKQLSAGPIVPVPKQLSASSVPQIAMGDVKSIDGYNKGLRHISEMEGRGKYNTNGNIGIALYDRVTGNVHLQVLGPSAGPGQPRRIIYEGSVGRILIPPGAPAPVGNLVEEPVRELVRRATGQNFPTKRSNAPGPDLTTRKPSP